MNKFFRWLPAALAPVIVAGAIAVPVAIANAAPNLPQRSASQILALSSRGQQVTGFTGDYAQQSNLGLPTLPTGLLPAGSGQANTGGGSAGIAALSNTLAYLSADQRGRISVGKSGLRVQSYTGDEEQDTILTRGNLWLWDSSVQHATHIKLPTLTVTERKKLDAVITLATPDRPVYTPQQAADGLLRGVDTHTRVSVGKAQYVAGQGTYTLVFTPRETASLIRDIRINIDAKTGMALRVAVYAKKTTDPAYELGYTGLRYGQPDLSVFRFSPPKQAKVTTQDYSRQALEKKYLLNDQAAGGKNKQIDGQQLPQSLKDLGGILAGTGVAVRGVADEVQVTGSGWASVVRVATNETTRGLLVDKQVRSLTSAGDSGSRVLSTALLNVVLHADGSIAFGSVPLSRLG